MSAELKFTKEIVSHVYKTNVQDEQTWKKISLVSAWL